MRELLATGIHVHQRCHELNAALDLVSQRQQMHSTACFHVAAFSARHEQITEAVVSQRELSVDSLVQQTERLEQKLENSIQN